MPIELSHTCIPDVNGTEPDEEPFTDRREHVLTVQHSVVQLNSCGAEFGHNPSRTEPKHVEQPERILKRYVKAFDTKSTTAADVVPP